MWRLQLGVCPDTGNSRGPGSGACVGLTKDSSLPRSLPVCPLHSQGAPAWADGGAASPQPWDPDGVREGPGGWAQANLLSKASGKREPEISNHSLKLFLILSSAAILNIPKFG